MAALSKVCGPAQAPGKLLLGRSGDELQGNTPTGIALRPGGSEHVAGGLQRKDLLAPPGMQASPGSRLDDSKKRDAQFVAFSLKTAGGPLDHGASKESSVGIGIPATLFGDSGNPLGQLTAEPQGLVTDDHPGDQSDPGGVRRTQGGSQYNRGGGNDEGVGEHGSVGQVCSILTGLHRLWIQRHSAVSV